MATKKQNLNIKAGDVPETDQEAEKLIENMAKTEAKKQAKVATPKREQPLGVAPKTLKIVRKDETGTVVAEPAKETPTEAPLTEEFNRRQAAKAAAKPVKVVKAKAEKPAKVAKPKAEKPAKVIEKSLHWQTYSNQTCLFVTAYTTQELLDKADHFSAAYSENAVVSLSGRVLVNYEVRTISGFAPATHIGADAWKLTYDDGVTVEPLNKTWDGAKISVAREGVLAKFHGKLNHKAESL